MGNVRSALLTALKAYQPIFAYIVFHLLFAIVTGLATSIVNCEGVYNTLILGPNISEIFVPRF